MSQPITEALNETNTELLCGNVLSRLDQSISEVFGTMLGMHVVALEAPVNKCKSNCGELITAIVGFAGVISGSCILQMPKDAAQMVTGAMVGATVTSMDNSVKDAIGELCNMVGGGWKNKLHGIGAQCLLSVPTVVTGECYEMHYTPTTCLYEREYEFEGMRMGVTLLCELGQKAA